MEKRTFCIGFGNWWTITDWRYSKINPKSVRLYDELNRNAGIVAGNTIFNMYEINKNKELVEIGDWSRLTQKTIDDAKSDMRLYEEVKFEIYEGKKVVEKFDGKLIDGLLWIYNNKKEYVA